MKKVLFLFIATLLLGGVSVKAQNIAGKEFTEVVCYTNSNTTLDLGKIPALASDLNLGAGEWHAVKNTMTTGGGANGLDDYTGVTDANFIAKVSNVFNLVGKPVGVYAFVFTATNSSCLGYGEKVLVKVVIKEVAIDKSHTLNLCPGATFTFTPQKVISSMLTDVVFDATGVVLSPPAALSGTAPNQTILIPDGYEGVFELNYKSNDAANCNNSAVLTVTVKQGVDGFGLLNNTALYCSASIPDVINLTTLAGASANDGKWSLQTTPAQTGVAVTADGDVTFTTDPVEAKDYIFEYTYKNCEATSTDVKETFTLTVSDDLSSSFTDTNKSICKSDNPNRIYDLMVDGFGLNVPSNSGTWTVKQEPAGNVGLDITNGQLAIKDIRIGEYIFNFSFSNAATELCNLAGMSKDLTLTVGDLSGSAVADGRTKLCVDQVSSASGNFTLTDFVVGLDGVNDVDWVGPTGTTITNGAVPYSELKALGVGVHLFNFSYTSAGCSSGTATGNLYIEITSDLNMSDVTINYCRPDMPTSIVLNEIISTSIPGTWAFVGSVTTATLSDLGTALPATGNNSIFTENPTVTGEKTYQVKFTPSVTGDTNCNAKEVTVTINIRDNSFN